MATELSAATPSPAPGTDTAFWRAAASRRDARPCAPWMAEEIAAVRDANAAAGAPPEALAAVANLANPSTLLVVTGQQAGLWLGPLYTLYKALAAVKWARRIEPLLGRPVRAAFWIASEDHDFEEVRHCHFLSREGDLRRWTYAPAAEPAPGTSVCDVAFEREPLLAFLDEVERETLDSPHRADALGRWRRHVTESENLEDLFARELLDLVGAMGLFFVAPHMAPLRRRATAVLGREIAAPGESTRRVVEAARRLEAAGKAAPVHRRGDEANFFVYREGRRCKVTVATDDLQTSSGASLFPAPTGADKGGAALRPARGSLSENELGGTSASPMACGAEPAPEGERLAVADETANHARAGGPRHLCAEPFLQESEMPPVGPDHPFFLIHDPAGTHEPERIAAVALLAELEAEPEHFSPNVLTRPLVQDAALPVIAYVGGPGEVRYLAQSDDAGLPEFFGVAASVVLTRPRALLLEPRAERRLRHFGIDEAALAREDWEAFEAALARAGSAGAAQDAVAALRADAQEAMQRLGARLGPLAERPAVVSAIEKTERSVMGAADALEGRLRAEAERADETESGHARRLRAALHPEGAPQERVLGVVAPFLAQYGPGFVPWIGERLDLDGTGVAVMRLGEMERKDPKDPRDKKDQ